MCHCKSLQRHLLVARRAVAAFICPASTFVQLIFSFLFFFFFVPCCKECGKFLLPLLHIIKPWY